MRNILVLLFLFVLTNLPLLSQSQQRHYPQEDINKKGDQWFTVDATTGIQTFNFYFGGTRARDTDAYSGFNALHVWFDSTTTSTPTTGDVDITIKPLIWDVVDERYEPNADSDTWVTVKSAYDWVAVHTDTSVSISYVLNLLAADGAQVIIDNDEGEDILTRVLIINAED